MRGEVVQSASDAERTKPRFEMHIRVCVCVCVMRVLLSGAKASVSHARAFAVVPCTPRRAAPPSAASKRRQAGERAKSKAMRGETSPGGVRGGGDDKAAEEGESAVQFQFETFEAREKRVVQAIDTSARRAQLGALIDGVRHDMDALFARERQRRGYADADADGAAVAVPPPLAARASNVIAGKAVDETNALLQCASIVAIAAALSYGGS